MLKNVSQSGKGVKSLGQVCSGICPNGFVQVFAQTGLFRRASLGGFVQASAQADSLGGLVSIAQALA